MSGSESLDITAATVNFFTDQLRKIDELKKKRRDISRSQTVRLIVEKGLQVLEAGE